MKYYHFYILLLFFSGLSFSSNAQSQEKNQKVTEVNLGLDLAQATKLDRGSILPAHKAYIYMEPAEEIALDPSNLKGADPQSMLSKHPMNCQLILQVFNPGKIAKIHVRLGTSKGQSDFVSQTFNFDQPAKAPFSYARDGKTVVLGLGQYTDMGSSYGEVILENLNGQRSVPKRFSSKG